MQYLLIAIFAVSCLMPNETQDKAFVGGGEKTPKELEKEQKKLREELKKERDEAKKTFAQRCGKVLKNPKWVHDWRNKNNNGFFFYETKSLACAQKQTVMIDVKAAHYMDSHYITCTKSADKRFLLKIPKSTKIAQREIKVDCQTNLLDIAFHRGELQLATIEKNGKTQKIMLNDAGQWQGEVATVTNGIEREELEKIQAGIELLHREGTLGLKLEQWKESSSDYLHTAGKGAAFGALTGLALALGMEASGSKTAGKSKNVGAVLVVGGAVAGGFVGMGIESQLQEQKKTPPNRAVLMIVRDYLQQDWRAN